MSVSPCLPRERVAAICCAILSHPTRHLPKLRILVNQLDIRSEAEANKLEFLSNQKMLAFSILEVFLDIIPSYRVKEKIKEEDDKKKRLKKTTYELRNFEATLLAIYKLFLLRLKRMADVLKKPTSRPSTFYDLIFSSMAAKERICLIGLKCLSSLLLTHPHFNLRSSIIKIIVPLTTLSKHPIVADKACECLNQLYQDDKLGEVTLEVVQETEKLVKACGIFIRPQVIETFLHIKINETAIEQNQKKDMKQVRKEWEKMSRKQRRRKKAEKKLENQMLETEAQESSKRISEYHTKILNHIFATYFRFLKRTILDLSDDSTKKDRFKILLSPVLEGLAKNCHLINIDFFDDVLNILFNLMKSELLDTVQILNCNQTVFTILSGEGSTMEVDHQRFYNKLYQVMLDINLTTSDRTVIMLFKCLEIMIIRKRRQVSYNRILAYMKRCSTLSLQTNDPTVLGLLAFLRRMFLDHPKSDLLIDIENVGSSQFLPHLDDPECCNANSTHLWELLLLRRHVNSSVQQFASHILKGCPSEELKLEMTKKSPIDFFESYDLKKFDYLLNEANEKVPISKKARFHGYIMSSSSLASQSFSNLMMDQT